MTIIAIIKATVKARSDINSKHNNTIVILIKLMVKTIEVFNIITIYHGLFLQSTDAIPLHPTPH